MRTPRKWQNNQLVDGGRCSGRNPVEIMLVMATQLDSTRDNVKGIALMLLTGAAPNKTGQFKHCAWGVLLVTSTIIRNGQHEYKEIIVQVFSTMSHMVKQNIRQQIILNELTS